MPPSRRKKLELRLHGMHCRSCEVLIERQWKKIPGIEYVQVNQQKGMAEVHYSSQSLDLEQLAATIAPHGYSIVRAGQTPMQETCQSRKREYLELSGVFLVLMAFYLILRQFDIFPAVGFSENMGYGLVFVLGLVAAFSTCLAVTGGLLLGVGVQYNQRHPSLTRYNKFRPTLLFNVGRLIGYTVFGGLIGAFGSLFTLSPRANGIVTVLASVVMILLGVQLLHLFPRLRRFQLKTPKFISHWIHDIADRHPRSAPFLVGAGTFFLPCGFTQALQLYVLSQGEVMRGALIMFMFALGTLPVLLSLGVFVSFAKGVFQRYLIKVTGVLIILLGVWSMRNGFLLSGMSLNFFRGLSQDSTAQAAPEQASNLMNGKQVREMTVVGLDYTPSRFTVLSGIPVEWRIDGRRAQGCARVITIPQLNIAQYLSPEKVTVINFTPKEAGTLSFRCTMGMTTSGAAFQVLPNEEWSEDTAAEDLRQESASDISCDPTIANCVQPQRFSMEISKEHWFSPNLFTVRRGVPVELSIDTKVSLGGCMGTLVVPEYNIAQALPVGKTVLRFTPTKSGVVPFTCSMGSPLGEFRVID